MNVAQHYAGAAYPLKWPEGWKRAKSRKQAAFKATMEVAIRDLGYEIERLQGVNPIISCNVPRTLSGAISQRGNPDNGDPGVAVYFMLKGQPRVFACDTFLTVKDNIRAISKTIEALRGIERWGASDMMERALSAFLALPPPLTWREVLDLPSGATADQVQHAHRRLAAKYHPDKPEGSPARMAEINAARDQAMKELAS